MAAQNIAMLNTAQSSITCRPGGILWSKKQCPYFRKGWQPLVLRSISTARTMAAQNITMLHTAQSSITCRPGEFCEAKNSVRYFRKGWQPMVLRSISTARTMAAQNITMLHSAQSGITCRQGEFCKAKTVPSFSERLATTGLTVYINGTYHGCAEHHNVAYCAVCFCQWSVIKFWNYHPRISTTFPHHVQLYTVMYFLCSFYRRLVSDRIRLWRNGMKMRMSPLERPEWGRSWSPSFRTLFKWNGALVPNTLSAWLANENLKCSDKNYKIKTLIK